jgi:hypothetical protein
MRPPKLSPDRNHVVIMFPVLKFSREERPDVPARPGVTALPSADLPDRFERLPDRPICFPVRLKIFPVRALREFSPKLLSLFLDSTSLRCAQRKTETNSQYFPSLARKPSLARDEFARDCFHQRGESANHQFLCGRPPTVCRPLPRRRHD